LSAADSELWTRRDYYFQISNHRIATPNRPWPRPVGGYHTSKPPVGSRSHRRPSSNRPKHNQGHPSHPQGPKPAYSLCCFSFWKNRGPMRTHLDPPNLDEIFWRASGVHKSVHGVLVHSSKPNWYAPYRYKKNRHVGSSDHGPRFGTKTRAKMK
jgi:hypothetical protein